MTGSFQSTINTYEGLGIPGELAFDGPMRSGPWNLFSSGVANIIGYAFTATANASPDTAAGSPNTGTATVGGTGVFAGILMSPKEQSATGVTGNPLGASLTLPDYTIGELLTMGQIFVNLPGPANFGDLVTYDPLTGALNSIPPSASFTASIAAGGSAGVADVMTVTALTQGVLAVGQLITGTGVAGDTYIASFGTGKGDTGTYNLNTINSQTVSSRVLTGSSAPATAFAASVASIAGTTLTITTLTSGQLEVGQQVFGTGVLANTVITAYGTGVGGTGTYTVNNSQTIGPIAMTGPANLVIPGARVMRFGADTSGGVAAIQLLSAS